MFFLHLMEVNLMQCWFVKVRLWVDVGPNLGSSGTGGGGGGGGFFFFFFFFLVLFPL